MLTPPPGLSEKALANALASGWDLTVAAMDYRPVGFGSHHWDVTDERGSRWFVTVDDASAAELLRLEAALCTATELRAAGCRFVVAPAVTVDEKPLVPIDDRYAVALYPYIEGESYDWGAFSTARHRRSVFDLIVELHTAPTRAARHALTDDFAIPYRHALARKAEACAGGPYSAMTAALLADNAEMITRQLVRYDELVTETRERSGPMVITHGEPHPANTMRTADGWVLIDWDTTLIAPPERDLWIFTAGDPSIIAAYHDATGVPPSPATLDLYRLRWDLADLAVFVSRFQAPHTDSADDRKSWAELRTVLSRLGADFGKDIHHDRGDRHGEDAPGHPE